MPAGFEIAPEVLEENDLLLRLKYDKNLFRPKNWRVIPCYILAGDVFQDDKAHRSQFLNKLDEYHLKTPSSPALLALLGSRTVFVFDDNQNRTALKTALAHFFKTTVPLTDARGNWWQETHNAIRNALYSYFPAFPALYLLTHHPQQTPLGWDTAAFDTWAKQYPYQEYGIAPLRAVLATTSMEAFFYQSAEYNTVSLELDHVFSSRPPHAVQPPPDKIVVEINTEKGLSETDILCCHQWRKNIVTDSKFTLTCKISKDMLPPENIVLLPDVKQEEVSYRLK